MDSQSKNQNPKLQTNNAPASPEGALSGPVSPEASRGGHASELRQDLVTGEWVVIATGRAKRPQAYIKKTKELLVGDIADCPFENPQAAGNGEAVLIYKNHRRWRDPAGSGDKKYPDWSLQIIPNKYPAFTHLDGCGDAMPRGEYLIREGRGYHEIIITRDHSKHIGLLDNEDVTDIVRAYQERYKILKKDNCVKYISIFHNHGMDAGASLPHPHSQLIALPILPRDIEDSLRGSNSYFRKKRECVHCVMIRQELKDKERVIFENDDFVVVCPFISRRAFEVRIAPKAHLAHFEETSQRSLTKFAESLRVSLKSIYDTLDNPDYNFFIHTAPADSGSYPNYHWHVEIIPHTEIWAGFELGTGIKISTIEPEKAAEYLRKAIEHK